MRRYARFAAAAAAAAALLAARSASAAELNFTLDGATALHRFDGHGALSAGASSRLLWDYPEPQRSQVLDYLFKPNFGMGLSILKVEIGGDGQSTDGTEPSHRHTRGDLSCARGYELFLIKEALKRNPQVLVYGLSWATPGWVNNGTYYGPEQVDYQTSWVQCIQNETGHVVDYMGLWNEKPQPSSDYVLALRAAFDASGFAATKIVVMDGGFDADEVATARNNSAYHAAVFGAGLHYPCDAPHPEVRDELGWAFWASEDYSRDPAWADGGRYWGKALSQNYILMNMTATISWSLIWSAYTNLVCNGAGLMRAHQPWTGNYEASAPVWLTAHWLQFASPGWRFLHVPGGGSGFLDVAGLPAHSGTYVTLVGPNPAADMTVVIETLDQNGCLNRSAADLLLTFTTRGGLPGPGTTLYVWMTTQSSYFVQLAPVTVAAYSTFSVAVPPDCMMTVSTVATASKGAFPNSPIPAAAPWPIPYADNFDGYAEDSLARFFADQGGSWAVRGGSNGSLQQVSGGSPAGNSWAYSPEPLTQVGDETWADYAVAATVRFSRAATINTGAASAAAPALEAVRRRVAERRSERQRQWAAGKGGLLPGQQRRRLAAAPAANPQALLVACDATDPSQAFFFGAPSTSPKYFNGVYQSAPICLDVAGSDPNVIDFYACVLCDAGAPCDNLEWAADDASGAFTGLSGLALTYKPDVRTLFLAPFTGAAQQVWRYSPATGQLLLVADGLCLSLPPVPVYAVVCGRLESYAGFDAVTTPGYCLNLFASGNWTLASNDSPIAVGSAPAPFDSAAPHRIAVSMAGDIVEAFLDGARVASVTNDDFAYGNAALGSGFHECAFDDFEVTLPL